MRWGFIYPFVCCMLLLLFVAWRIFGAVWVFFGFVSMCRKKVRCCISRRLLFWKMSSSCLAQRQIKTKHTHTHTSRRSYAMYQAIACKPRNEILEPSRLDLLVFLSVELN